MFENEWTYVREVVRGKAPVDPLSSLEMNLIALEILYAAREGGGAWCHQVECCDEVELYESAEGAIARMLADRV